jgi:hypothetical protein
MMWRGIRSPLLHYLLLGTALFAAQPLLPPPSEPVVIDAAQKERLRADWQRAMRREPDAAEMAALLQAHADSEILLREALAAGLDGHDPVARARLLQNLRFALPGDARADESLLAEARALDMPRRDPVVRQRLIERMRQRLAHGTTLDADALARHVAAHPQRYAAAPRLRFEQRFFSRDLRGDTAPADASAALAALHDGQEVIGDVFLLGAEYPPLSPAEIEARFGPAVAQTLAAAPERQWLGPVESVYGSHLLRVVEHIQPAETRADRVPARAAYAALAERERVQIAQALDTLRRRYPVRVEADS